MSLREAARVEAEQVRLTLAVAIVTVYCQLDQAYATQDLLQQKLKVSQRVTTVLRERTARGPTTRTTRATHRSSVASCSRRSR